MITLFENFMARPIEYNYKKGDYVLLKHKSSDMSIELECLILDVYVSQEYCDIEVFDEDGDLITIDIDMREIERKMTPEEEERYKLRKESKKYNI